MNEGMRDGGGERPTGGDAAIVPIDGVRQVGGTTRSGRIAYANVVSGGGGLEVGVIVPDAQRAGRGGASVTTPSYAHIQFA